MKPTVAMKTEFSPYAEGYRAYWSLTIAEDLIPENPYPAGSVDAFEFTQGHQDAQYDRDFELRRA